MADRDCSLFEQVQPNTHFWLRSPSKFWQTRFVLNSVPAKQTQTRARFHRLRPPVCTFARICNHELVSCPHLIPLVKRLMISWWAESGSDRGRKKKERFFVVVRRRRLQVGWALINKRLVWKAAAGRAEGVGVTPSELRVIIMAVQCWFKYLFHSKSDRVSLSYASGPVEMSGLISLTFSYTHRYHTGRHTYSRPHTYTHGGMWSSLRPCCLLRVQTNSPRLRQDLSNLMSIKPAPPTKDEQSFFFCSSDKGQIQITKSCEKRNHTRNSGWSRQEDFWSSGWFGGLVSTWVNIIYCK